MVLYWSGTGNSAHIAAVLARALDDRLANLGERMRSGDNSPLVSEKRWVLVCPVYGWRVPRVVTDYLDRCTLRGSREMVVVVSCGTSSGNAQGYARRFFRSMGIRLAGFAEVRMPENYLALFETPGDEEARALNKWAERAIVRAPKVMLMDEPLSNLDAKLRMEMRTELKRLHRDTDSTFVYVTHDQLEAMTLSTKVCIMETGVLQQYAPPLEMYNNPANLFVADFMGNPTMNFIDGRINQDGLVEFGGMKARFEAQAGEAAGNRNVVVGIRPEYIHIDEDGVKEATVYSTLPSGMETTVKLDVQGTSLTAVVFGDVDYPVDSKVKFAFHKAAVLFDKESGKNIARGRLTLE